MAESSLVPVQFNGATLVTTLIDGVPYVALRPICESIGVDWQAQHARIKRHPVLNSVVSVTKTTAADGKQYDMLMLPLDKLNGWLFGVSVNRCKPELRPRLIQYQAECFDVLAAHFGAMKHPVSTTPEPSLKNRRWLVSFDPRDGREIVQPVPADAYVLTIPEFCTAIEAGDITGRAFMDVALAVNQRQYSIAVDNKAKGIGEEMASKVRGLSDADLHTINQRASMEVWMRTSKQARAIAA